MAWIGTNGERRDGVFDLTIFQPATPPTTGGWTLTVHIEQSKAGQGSFSQVLSDSHYRSPAPGSTAARWGQWATRAGAGSRRWAW